MTSMFDPTLALTLLTHPFQVALTAATLGALVREGVRAWIEGQTHVIDRTTTTDINVNIRAAA